MDCVNHPGTPATAFCQNCGKALCGGCVRTAPGGQVLCEPCFAAWQTYPQPFVPVSTGSPNPAAAAVLGLIPGVGAMYNGQFFKGLIHVVIFAVLVSMAHISGIFGIFIPRRAARARPAGAERRGQLAEPGQAHAVSGAGTGPGARPAVLRASGTEPMDHGHNSGHDRGRNPASARGRLSTAASRSMAAPLRGRRLPAPIPGALSGSGPGFSGSSPAGPVAESVYAAQSGRPQRSAAASAA